ncbi:MAG: 50S ribosomal protein L18Ae [Methanomassiliicoccales archaeon]
MKAFRVIGTFKVGPKRKQYFSIEVAAKDKDGAIHTVFCNLGSRHRLPRRAIQLSEIRELSPDEIENSVVKYLVGVTE